MCRTCGRRHNSLEDDVQQSSPEVSAALYASAASLPLALGGRVPGKINVRGRTMKEYEEQLSSLKKENFDLKLRIYFLEEGVGNKYGRDDKRNVYKTNIELKVETEALKRDLLEKQELVREASHALQTIDSNYQLQLDDVRKQFEADRLLLQERNEELEKELEAHERRQQAAAPAATSAAGLGELTQLCNLAFATDDESTAHASGTASAACRQKESGFPSVEQQHQYEVALRLQQSAAAGSNVQQLPPAATQQQQLQLASSILGIQNDHQNGDRIPSAVSPFSLSSLQMSEYSEAAAPTISAAEVNFAPANSDISNLEERIVELEALVSDLEDQLNVKDETVLQLEFDLDSLKVELEEKGERILQLEAEVSEHENETAQIKQELEQRQLDNQQLHRELQQVEPQVEVKVRELHEREKTIGNQQEKIDEQNKILVEIQITLDEKLKQVEELETALAAKDKEIKRLDQNFAKSTSALKIFAEKHVERNKQIASLKNEVKKKDRRINALIAELKECVDMLKKSQWEAQQAGSGLVVCGGVAAGQDGMKEMAEEENERLWAELEERKKDSAEHQKQLQQASARVSQLEEQLNESKMQLQEAREQLQQLQQNSMAELQRLAEKGEMVARLEGELTALKSGRLASTASQNDNLHSLLEDLKSELKDKLQEAETLQKEKEELVCDLKKTLGEVKNLEDEKEELTSELRRKSADIQDAVNKELWDRNKEIEKLREKVNVLTCEKDTKQEENEAIKREMEVQEKELAKLKELTAVSEKMSTAVGDSRRHTANQNVPRVESVRTDQSECLQQQQYRPMETNLVIAPQQNTVVNVSQDSNSIAMVTLQMEVSRMRGEIKELTTERRFLAEKLSQLQNDSAAFKSPKPEKLEESKETSAAELSKSPVKASSLVALNDGDELQQQVGALKVELASTQKKINRQLAEVNLRKYRDAMRRQKVEMTSLKKRLAESHNTCEMLRNRLEELADFLEQILELDERGLINLSQLSSDQITLLHKSLNESRALSRSLSQSVMLGVDSLLEVDEEARDDATMSSSISSLASWASLQREDGLEDPPDLLISSQEALSIADDKLCNETRDGLDVLDVTRFTADRTTNYEEVLKGLKTDIEKKTAGFEDVVQRVEMLKTELETKTQLIEDQDQVILELRRTVDDLEVEIHQRDMDLLKSEAENVARSIETSGASMHVLLPSCLSHSSSQTTLPPSMLHSSMPSSSALSHDSLSGHEALHPSSSAFSDTLPNPHHVHEPTRETINSNLSRGRAERVDLGSMTDQELELNQQAQYCHNLKSPFSLPVNCNNSRSTCFNEHAIGEISASIDEAFNVKSKTKLDVTSFCRENTTMNQVCVNEEVAATASLTLVSPSESEAWSEPDRNVSQARIGLEAECRGTTGDSRSLSRSRQRSSAVSTSESAALEESLSNSKSRRNSEMRRLIVKVKNLEQLNGTLREELNICQNLCAHVNRQATDSEYSNAPKVDKSTATAATTDEPLLTPSAHITVPVSLVEEIRALRGKLEEAIVNNDHLRNQLEVALAAHSREEGRIEALKSRLAACNAQLKEAESRTQEAEQRLKNSTSNQEDLNEKLVAEEVKVELERQRSEELQKQATHLRQLLEGSEDKLKQIDVELTKKNNLLEEFESKQTSLECKLEDKEEKLTALHERIEEVEKEKKNSSGEIGTTINQLQTRLEESEDRMLQMNNEKLRLLGEVKKLRAQRAGLSAQAHLQAAAVAVSNSSSRASSVGSMDSLHSMQSELDVSRREKSLLREETLNLRTRVSQLAEYEKQISQFKKEREQIHIELRQVTDSSETEEKQEQERNELVVQIRLLIQKKTSLENEKNCLVDKCKTSEMRLSELNTACKEIHEEKDSLAKLKIDLTRVNESLKCDNEDLQNKLSDTQQRKEQHQTDNVLLKRETEALRGNLDEAMLRKEHVERENLQLKRDKDNIEKELHATEEQLQSLLLEQQARTTTSVPVSPFGAASDITSPVSVTSFEFCPTQQHRQELTAAEESSESGIATNGKRLRPTSLPSGAGRRNQRICDWRWEDNKENNVPLLQTRKQSFDGTRSTAHPIHPSYQGEGLGDHYHQPPTHQQHPCVSSPDLGIGSDCQFSSLERGVNSLAKLAACAATPLCQQPNHGGLEADMARLHEENASLQEQLSDALRQLSAANHRKQSVERAVCRQLRKTHSVLQRTKGNLQNSVKSSVG